ncbi:hypothetical protein AAMO2058_001014900 [Amorphochlora amoebiformis]
MPRHVSKFRDTCPRFPDVRMETVSGVYLQGSIVVPIATYTAFITLLNEGKILPEIAKDLARDAFEVSVPPTIASGPQSEKPLTVTSTSTVSGQQSTKPTTVTAPSTVTSTVSDSQSVTPTVTDSQSVTSTVTDSQSGKRSTVTGEGDSKSADSKSDRIICPLYPTRPLAKQILCKIIQWGAKGEFPVELGRIKAFHNSIDHEAVKRLKSLSPDISKLVPKLLPISPLPQGTPPGQSTPLGKGTPLRKGTPSEDVGVIRETLMKICGLLKWDGALSLLGIERTVGSMPSIPPPLPLLVQNFKRLHTINSKKSGSILTTGARAWTKHAHRCSKGFWGVIKGSEAQKNAKAFDALKRVLTDAIWLNIHKTCEGTFLEIRNSLGYGVRWTADSVSFRGFLEPHVEGGHDVKWRH